MTNNKNNETASTGPQGTQVFDLDEVNKMVADEIANSRSNTANIPALVGLSSSHSGQQFILSKDKIEVGRRPNSDIVLNENSVSAMHAQIIKAGDGWKVLNLLSSNGTFVNGEKVVERIINVGDRIAFAEAEFVFTLVDDETQVTSKSSNSFPLILIAVGVIAAFSALYFFVL
jgi:pSer/pThr/pTyr-binding forkhead associated (FHA) protein